jgi:UDP-N-acetylglucosamine 2-epimerase (non-hydrolysing)
MDKEQVCLVAGTRPEVIKLAPVYFALQQSAKIRPVWLSTGQHREMLDQALKAFGIVPDLDLELMQMGQTPPSLTARAIEAVGRYLRKLLPAAVIVQGDTSTVLASALAAFYEQVPIAHVEAGLRTYDMQSPWPEEMNRRLISPLCRWNFAPTSKALENLVSERIRPTSCHVTGNTVVDALQWICARNARSNETAAHRAARVGLSTLFAQRYLGAGRQKWILLTLHRRESFGAGLEQICRAIRDIVRLHPDCGVVCPMHLNPSAREPVIRILSELESVALIEPLAYPDFVWLLEHCHFVISDSGGVQEEAPSLGKPVLIARTTTERTEGVDAGTSRLVGVDSDKIVVEASELLDDSAEYDRRSCIRNPFGDGQSAARIASVLERDLTGLA